MGKNGKMKWSNLKPSEAFGIPLISVVKRARSRPKMGCRVRMPPHSALGESGFRSRFYMELSGSKRPLFRLLEVFRRVSRARSFSSEFQERERDKGRKTRDKGRKRKENFCEIKI